MCGIVGYFTLDGTRPHQEHVLDEMAEAVHHRGPDSSGVYRNAFAGFGFRRLSIIDLATGDQPLQNEDGSVILICNGEIFNYQELRAELQGKGHVFATRSDVEVLIHLYEDYGTDLLQRVNGQFAFAILDLRRRFLMLARDHVGIAPLYYTQTDGLLIFASEIKAILRHPSVQRRPDLTGLDQVFTFPGLISPRTAFAGIKRLQPGHYLAVADGEVHDREYWDLDYPLLSDLPDTTSEADHISGLAEHFERSVRMRLQADVPVGFYLSGGLDSSLTAAFISRLSPDVARHAFAISFTDRKADEARYQKLMAESINCQLHMEEFDWSRTASMMRRMIYHAESPVKETYNTCSMELSRVAQSHGIKVILTGEGADELFAGYVGYRFDRAREQQRGTKLAKKTDLQEQRVREDLWGDGSVHYELDYYVHQTMRKRLYAPALRDSFEEFNCLHHPLVRKDRISGRHPLHQRSYLDFKLRMADHLLMDHGDSMALANSVEARYPFLDIGLVEYAKSVPPNMKLRGYTEKYILRKVGEGLVPDAILNREKFGWFAPGTPEMLQQGVEWIQDALSAETIRRQGYFDASTIESLKQQYSQPGFQLNQPFECDWLMVVATFGLMHDIFSLSGVV